MYKMLSTLTVILLNLGSICCKLALDNAVSDLPEVYCHDDMVKMVFHTKKPFRGRIFVRGMVEKSQCVTDFVNNTENSVNFELKNGDCNMRRQRKIGFPKGVEHSMTVVVSFHHTFLTQVDKAYRCTCFFMEADKILTSQVDVSMIPTVDLMDTPKSPVCTYNVRRGTLNGPLTTFANVGDKLWHVWKCDSDMFEMLVHSCVVDNGKAQDGQEVLDKKGCPVDPLILGQLTYNIKGNMAYIDVQAFKFPDESVVYYQCSVSLCMKGDNGCDKLSPPLCGSDAQRTRFKRMILQDYNRTRQQGPLETFDVSNTLTIFDLGEVTPLEDSLAQALIDPKPDKQLLCLGPISASLLYGLLITIFCAFTTVILIWMWARNRRRRQSIEIMH